MTTTLPSELFAFACPGCGEPLLCRPRMDVDGARDPQVRELLMRGELNTFACEGCGHRGETPIPVLYRNSRLGFSVAYVPPHLLESRSYAELFLADGQPRPYAFAQGLEMVLQAAVRVFSMAELARQVRFREMLAKHLGGAEAKAPAPAPPPAPARKGPAQPQYRKGKLLLLRRLARRFEPGRDYASSDVTIEIAAALRSESHSVRENPTYSPDHLRLGLIELGLLARDPAGTRYWVP